MKLAKILMLLTLVTVFISGCSSTDEKDASLTDRSQDATDASTTGYSDSGALSGTEMQAYGSNGALMGGAFADPNSPLSKSTIYFMYDSSQVQQVFVSIIAAHAEYLSTHPEQRVILEGHADERGSPEYNIALGEQRAKAVTRMMEMQGVSAGQLEIVSYGEEKPAEFGQDEAAWQLNRRVEIAYQAM